MVIEMMDLLILTLFLVLLLAISLSPPTPKEVLDMRQKSGALSNEGWELLEQFKEQYGTPLQLVAPVISEIQRRIFLANELKNISQNLNNLLSPSALASRRLATLEQTGAMEQELQRQAQALGASGMRSGSLARALMGARMGMMMERARMMADANLQEQLLRQQIMEHQYQLKEREQMIREQKERDRFRLLMGLRSGLEEQAVKGGALTMENIFQAEQLAAQQTAAFMQGLGALGNAYAQYRQHQELLRTLRSMQQPQQPQQ
jgi:hypothetical protein